jgi:hypothetical protein
MDKLRQECAELQHRFGDITVKRDCSLLTQYLNLENYFLTLKMAFGSQSVTILGKHHSNIGKRTDYISRSGNTSRPIMPAIF